MSIVSLSYCLPTYKRPERVRQIIKQFIQFQSKEIEIVIGDDDPSDIENQEFIRNVNDTRVKYFKNRKNLGYDANLWLTIKRASGKFVFLLMDDDDIEVNVIPWILKIIKSNVNITQIRGSLGNNNSNNKGFYFECQDKLLKKGYLSLKELPFGHASGTVLRKAALNLIQAKEQIGSFFIQQIFITQAALKGDTLLSKKVFASIGSKAYKSQQPNLLKGIGYNHPIGWIIVTKYRIHMIYNLTKGKLRRLLLRIENLRIIHYLNRIINPYLSQKSFTIFETTKTLFKGLITVFYYKKILLSPRFWKNLMIGLYLITFYNNRFIELYNRICKT